MDKETLNKGNVLIKKIENTRGRIMSLEDYRDELTGYTDAKKITRIELHFWVENEEGGFEKSESMSVNTVYASLLIENITSLINHLHEEIEQCEKEFEEL